MCRQFILLQLILFLFSKGFSQKYCDINGYLVNLSFYQEGKKINSFELKNRFMNLDRLRLRSNLSFNDNCALVVENETSILYKNTSTFVFEHFTLLTGQIANLRLDLLKNDLWQISSFIDRLFIKVDFENLNITLGRQRIAWGTGRIWNPLDFFNPINPTNFSKIEKDGVDAVNLKWNISSLTDLSVVLNLQKNNSSNYAARFRTNFLEFDWSFLGGYIRNIPVIGTDFAGNLFNAGFRGEFLVSFENSNKVLKFILGADYQFTPKLYTLIEYHYNGYGKINKHNYDFSVVLSGKSIYLAQDYIVFSTSYLVHPLLNLVLIVNNNLNDASRYYSINVGWSMTESISLNLGVLFFVGKNYSEYYYYPNIYFLRSEYYF